MSMTLALIPCAAHLADQGLPRLAATAVVLAIAALASVPMLLAVSSKKLVAAWLMQVGGINGWSWWHGSSQVAVVALFAVC